MRRILILNNTDVMGGAEKSLLEFLRVVANGRCEFQMYVACPTGSALAHQLEEFDVGILTVPFVCFRRTKNPFRLLKYLCQTLAINFQVGRIIGERGIDLLHANTISAGLQGVLAAKRHRIPFILHVRDWPGSHWLFRILEPWVDHVVTVSNAVRDQIPFCHEAKVSTVYNPISVPQARANASSASPPADMTMVAQYVPWKNHELMIEIVQALREKYADIKLLFVGAVHSRNAAVHLQALRSSVAERGLQTNVFFLEHTSDIFELISASKMLIHPALNEPMGRVIGEAMLLGTPVIAARSGAHPEIIEDGTDGILVEPRNVRAFVSAIDRLLRGEIPASLIENARRKARQMFCPERQSNTILQIYRDALEVRQQIHQQQRLP